MEGGSFAGDGRGQSATIGVSLLFGITIVGTVAVVVLGAAALTDTQHRSEVERAEHMMTQFDSQASLVALGQVEKRSVSFDQSDGTYSIDPDAGTVQIVHANFDGTNDDGDDVPGGNNDDEIVYEGMLGAVVYENGDTTIAYQGGGVWRRDASGRSRMVSPPEFHYRGATLTFPVVQVTGQGSASGRVTGEIRGGSTGRVYPDAARTYNGTSKPYLNPQRHGEVYLNVTSVYYEAWADYFRERTDSEVVEFPEQNKIKVKLISTGLTGPFQMPGEGGSITVRGVTGHSMTDYSIRIVDDQNDSADMDNLKWTMWVEDGDKQFEMHLRKSGGSKCPDTITVKTVVYYSPPDGDSDTSDPYHGWKNESAYETACEDVDGDGENETVLDVDFVDDENDDNNVSEIEDGDEMLDYTSLGSSDTIHFGNPGNNLLLDNGTSPAAVFDGHGVYWESRTYDDDAADSSYPSEESIDRIINHYFSELGPGFDLTVDDKDSNTVSERLSGGLIDYEGGDEFVTYMHITENDISVEFG